MTLLRKLALAVFSFWVWASGFAWMSVGVLATIALRLLGVPYQKVHVWVTAPMFSSCVRLATIRLRVHYHPRFDRERRSVFCQNHINLLDGHVASAAIPHAFSGLMHAWQFKIPIYGWLMTLSKGIPVHEGHKTSVIDEISRAARNRRDIGMSVLTFPEGHRTLTGRTGPFRRGVFLMARNAEMPVVPLAVRGLYAANNKTMGLRFAPFQRVDVFVGPQFETTGKDDKDIAALADRLRAYVQTVLDTGEFPRDETIETAGTRTA